MYRYLLLIHVSDVHRFMMMLSKEKHWNASSYDPWPPSRVPGYSDSIEIDATEEELVYLKLQYRIKVLLNCYRVNNNK